MQRSSLNRVPGRLAFNAISLYSKEGTTIDTDLIYSQEPVGVAGLGLLDLRDREAYAEITLMPDGRVNGAIAGVLWPYNNPTLGTGIFTDTDFPAVIHGLDASLDTYGAAAVLAMPPMYFHPVKTLIGQLKLLCLRAHSAGQVDPWSTANSLRSYANSGGSFADPSYSNSAAITQDYTLTWGAISGWASLDFYDGLTFEPKIEYVDDNVAVHGLFNRRIQSVGGLLRGIPIGVTRSMIDSQLQIQGAGAGRGASGAAKAAPVTVTGADGKVYLSFPLGQLVKSKIQNGVEQLREGEVAWAALPNFAGGLRGPYFTTPIA